MSRKIFINLPVKDLNRSKNFYTKLGFSVNEQFSNEEGACIVISEDIYVMLLVEKFFKTFIKKEIADSSRSAGAIFALSAEDRVQVDEMVNTALKNGGSPSMDKMEQHGMYGWSFQDPDGHLWEVFYMDMSVVPEN